MLAAVASVAIVVFGLRQYRAATGVNVGAALVLVCSLLQRLSVCALPVLRTTGAAVACRSDLAVVQRCVHDA